MNLPLIAYTEWVKRLQQCDRDAGEAPALKLLDFFVAGLEMESQGCEAGGIPPMDCNVAKQSSRHLQQAKPIQPSEVEAWLNYWEDVGFIAVSK